MIQQNKKELEMLEKLQTDWKLWVEWVDRIQYIRKLIESNEMQEKLVDTTMQTSLSLMIEHQCNEYILDKDLNIIDKTNSSSLKNYYDIKWIGYFNLSDETADMIQETAISMVIMLPLGWWAFGIWKAVGWRVVASLISKGLIKVWSRLARWIAISAAVTSEWFVWWSLYYGAEVLSTVLWNGNWESWESIRNNISLDKRLSRVAMSAILWRIWKINSLHPNALQKLSKLDTIKITWWRILIEETLIGLADAWFNFTLWDGTYSTQEFLEWMVMWAAFEFGGLMMRGGSKPDTYKLDGHDWRVVEYTKKEMLALLKEDPSLRSKIEWWANWKETINTQERIDDWLDEAVSAWKESVFKKFWSFLNKEKAWMQEMLWNIKLQVTKVKKDIMNGVIFKKNDQWVEAQRNFLQCMWNLSKVWVVLWSAWVPPIAFIPWSSVLTFYLTQNRKPIKKLFWFTFEAVSYFEGKISKFWFTELQARNNSALRWEKWSLERASGKEKVRERYIELAIEKWLIKSADEFKISDDMLDQFEIAHDKDGELWNLGQWELLGKVKIIDMALAWQSKAKELRLLGLEAWLFGTVWWSSTWVDNTESNGIRK
jgi:hypothetical protein